MKVYCPMTSAPSLLTIMQWGGVGLGFGLGRGGGQEVAALRDARVVQWIPQRWTIRICLTNIENQLIIMITNQQK